MKLKPFRSYDEHDVINLYSLAENSGNAGELVKYQSFNPSDWEKYTTNLSPYVGAMIPRMVNQAKVALATASGEADVAGMLLVDVRNSDDLGRPLIYDAQRWQELNVAYSGQTVPVVRRGLFIVSGFQGTPNVGSGIGVADAGGGNWKVLHPFEFTPGYGFTAAVNVSGAGLKKSLGRFFSQTGSDGYAVAFLDIRS